MQRACRSGQASAIRLLRAHLPRLAGQSRDGGGWQTGITVQEAQFTLARDYGFETWPKMMALVDGKAGELVFADSIRKILELARTEAARRGDREVGSGHLLPAVAGEEMRPVAGPLLERLGATPDEVRRRAESSVSAGRSQAGEGPFGFRRSQFGPAAKKVLEFAAAEARGSGAGVVQCEHLLLGLLKAPDAGAARMLESMGLRYEAAKERLTGRASPQ